MSNIHPTAIVEDGAEIGEGVEIGPYCVISANAKIGDGACLKSHVVIDGNTTIGAKCSIFPFASIGTRTQDLKYKGGTTYVEVGEGTTLREYVTVNSGTEDGEVTRVGSGCNLLAYTHVGHGCNVGNGVIMSNLAQLSGHVVVEDYVVMGGMTGVHQFVKIGRMCMIGGCSKITQDVAPYLLADGNPGAVHGLNLIGMKRRGLETGKISDLKKAFKTVYRDGLPLKDALAKVEAELETGPEISHFVEFLRGSERGILR